MDPSLQPLLRRLEHLSEQFHELREGVKKAVLVADLDPEMALTRARKVLELVIREVYQRRCDEPPGTRPLENLIQRLVKDGFFPDRLDAYAAAVRKLGNVGTHTFGESITAADVYQSLTQLMPILEWYFETERPEAVGRQTVPAEVREHVGGGSAGPSPAAPPRMAVVPKGLRSFDANDADFFLGLLPGPRDKDGLPESVRFWKHRVEAGDEPTFTVGVIYGPSGCGKSSLVKAGLLPRLAGRVLAVYVEATADDTEARLLQGLRKRRPDLPGDLGLKETIVLLRQGGGRKVLLVLDQFEQWLHARQAGPDAELAQALRQCDGERVQCVLLVRDDFWVALSRFMGALNIELLQGQNIALVDLFDPIHARDVLSAFGRAFGRLPDEPSKEQESFLDQAVYGLAEDGRVISVRLALFAEMVKGKPWTPATLKAVGGTAGVGVAFLEETFNAGRLRPHQQAARAVLKALLPESGADIKGGMRSHDALREASGYGRRPKDFEELLRVLDGEVRLITPTDPEGKDDAGEPGGVSPRSSDARYYQLTHDYLVPSLRAWLTRKQKETRRGRAELRLAERAAAWNARPESRHLPAWWEWLNILLFTRKKDWTPPQAKMMRQATRHHAVRGTALALVLLALTLAGLGIRGQVVEQNKATQAAGLVRQLLDAEITQTPDVIRQMEDYRRWTDPLLRDAYAEAESAGKAADTEAERAVQARKQLHASLGLLPVDASQVEYLYGRLLDAEPGEAPVIRDALAPHREALVDRLWAVVETPEKGKEPQRLRAAAALAGYDPEDGRWDKAGALVADELVAENPVFLGQWSEAFRPVKGRLLSPLSEIFRDRRPGRAAERSLATNLLADYAADQPQALAELVMDADERQLAVLYPKFREQGERGLALLDGEIDQGPPPGAGEEAKERLAKRRANAAAVLLKMNRPAKVWPLLKQGPDPRTRSHLIHRLGPLRADAAAVVRRLDEEPDVSIRRALLLSLGEYDETGLPPEARLALLPKVRETYRTAPDPGLHAACEWLLRQWQEGDWLRPVNDEWANDQGAREKRLDDIRRLLAKDAGKAPQWYVNGQGQTMVVIPGPVEFLIGSPPTEAGREGGPAGENERQQPKQIRRSFAVAARTATVGQFLRFRKEHKYEKDYSPTDDCPVNGVSWYAAAAYCNWLSGREGIAQDQWCYLPNEQGEYGEGMRLAPDYLHRTGYRLPSEAEWEYACRAGAVTGRSYGEGEELLGQYAWYTKVSLDRGMLPGAPGRLGVRGDCLKPNDFGLFDMLGNAWEWCQDRMAPYRPGEDVEGELTVKAGDNRPLRGGCFYTQARYVRCAYRDQSVPGYLMSNNGFRVARTIAP